MQSEISRPKKTQKQVPCKEYDAHGFFFFKSDYSIETECGADDDGSETISKVKRVQSREERCAQCAVLWVSDRRPKSFEKDLDIIGLCYHTCMGSSLYACISL